MLTCLIVTLSVTLPTPLKVNATDDNTSKYLYVIGTIAAYAGIDIDVNEVATRFPNFVDEVMALADEIYTEYADTYSWTNDTESGHTGSGSHRDGSDGVIQAANDIQGYLDYLVSGLKPFNPVASLVDYRFVFCLIRAIARWCDENIHSSSIPEGSSLGDVATVSGYVDFYTQGSFSFTFPTLSDSTMVIFPLNNCSVQYLFNPTYFQWDSWLLDGSSTNYSINPGYYLIKISPNNYDFSFVCGLNGYVSSFSGKTFLNQIWDPHFDSAGEYIFDCFLKSSDNNAIYLLHRYGYFVSGSKRYRLTGSRNSTFSFVNTSDSSDIYNDLVFNTGFDALVWFFDMCGINIRRGSPSSYIAVDTSPSPIVIDNTTYDNTVNNITNVVTNNTYQEGDAVEMVFPSYYITNNYYNYDDYRQHPEYILDFDQDGLLNSDFNMPSYDGNILATKFPFCIPFDIIHLFTNFSAEAEAPELHFVVLPENSFNLGNDEFSIDIDFQDYHVIVQLLRFFIAAGFVLWLMVVTNRVLHH